MSNSSALAIRRARPADAVAIARLFHNTVHRVNARDYRPDQLRAWAPRVYPEGFWKRRLRRWRVVVAVDASGLLVGFAELDASGAIGCLYVHHERQRQGIGAALLRHLERQARRAGIRRLGADASVTALPLFRALGFHTVRRQSRSLRNRRFRQYAVLKPLARVPEELTKGRSA